MGLRSSREGSLEEAVLAVGWEWLLGGQAGGAVLPAPVAHALPGGPRARLPPRDRGCALG